MAFRGGIGEMMRQANRLQRKIEQRKEELKSETVEASSGNGQVAVVVNGAKEIVRLTIAPDLLKNEEIELVQDLIVAATNAGLTKAQELIDSELEKVTGGVKLPI